jgi:hypothetical protein
MQAGISSMLEDAIAVKHGYNISDLEALMCPFCGSLKFFSVLEKRFVIEFPPDNSQNLVSQVFGEAKVEKKRKKWQFWKRKVFLKLFY